MFKIKNKTVILIPDGRETKTALATSVVDPHHPEADPDPACHFDADPDPDPAYCFDADPDAAYHFNADPDPAYHFDADTDPAFQFDPDPQHCLLQSLQFEKTQPSEPHLLSGFEV
jgi:hypothetical protein